jgi:hypothetical protein
MKILIIFGAISIFTAHAAVLKVGPGMQYATPCQAISAANDGDTIEIAAGSYPGSVCSWKKNRLSIKGVGGRVQIDAAGQSADRKAIWMIYGSDTVVENIEFSGARVTDRNGAGIKLTGGNLTIRNCIFRNNENGVLTSDNPSAEVLIERSEFAYNGTGSGQTHNVYIGRVKKLTFQYNYTHHAKVGHLLKSRAIENHILYNRITNEASGTASREIDLPNGGRSFLIGNLIQQGASSQNTNLVGYLKEGSNPYTTDHRLFVANNTFVNDHSSGTFLSIASGAAPVLVLNNIFSGPGTVISQSGAVLLNNLVAADPKFVDRKNYDYRLTASSPAIDYGIDPNGQSQFPLAPVAHYIHTTSCEQRVTRGTFDAGAYEFGGGMPASGCSSSSSSAPSLALQLSANSVAGGQTVSGDVQLNHPAPVGGMAILLGTSRPDATSLAPALSIPEGKYGITFPIQTKPVPIDTVADISVSAGSATAKTALTVRASSVAANLKLIRTNLPSVGGGLDLASNRVYLDTQAPSGGVVVLLTSSHPSIAAVPSSVTVPAGATIAFFSIRTSPVTAAASVTISASYGGITKSAPLIVDRIMPVSFSFVQQSIKGGTATSGNLVYLNGPAPQGGLNVTFKTSSSLVSASTITVPAGATAGIFSLRTSSTLTKTLVTITATAGGVGSSKILTITP